MPFCSAGRGVTPPTHRPMPTSQPSETRNATSFRKSASADAIKDPEMRSSGFGGALNPTTSILRRDAWMRRRDSRGRAWATRSWERPEDTPPGLRGGPCPAPAFRSNFQPPGRELVSVVLSPSFAGICSGGPGKLRPQAAACRQGNTARAPGWPHGRAALCRPRQLLPPALRVGSPSRDAKPGIWGASHPSCLSLLCHVQRPPSPGVPCA